MRLLISALLPLLLQSPPASTVQPSPDSVRAARCQADREKSMAAGWDMSSIHLSCEPGMVLPVATHMVKPHYTAKALHAKIQGAVTLDVVVETDGRIREARASQSLDRLFGLDEEAVKAAKATKFKPATQLGKPVRILVTVELTFTLG